MVAFALLHSPSVGPATWQPVADALRARGHEVAVPDVRSVAAGPPPYAERVVQLAAEQLRSADGRRQLIVAGHSNAGLFLPALARRTNARAIMFVDASIPPDDGAADMVPAPFLDDLRARTVDGLLPRWTDWFSEEDVAPLFPDDATRAGVIAEQPQLPLAYYEERVPVPHGWTALPCAYLLFSSPYAELAEAALERGWPVTPVHGEHLHMLVNPSAVADALLDLSARIAGWPLS